MAAIWVAAMAAIWVGVGSDRGGLNVRETFRVPADDDYEVQRRRFVLGLKTWPDWLTAGWQPRLVSRDVVEEFSNGVDLIGLARLTHHGSVHWESPLKPIESREENLLQDLYQRPLDGCRVKIIESMHLETPIRITHFGFTSSGTGERKYRKALERDVPFERTAESGKCKNMKLLNLYFSPVLPADVAGLPGYVPNSGRTMSVNDTLASWNLDSAPFAIVLPPVLAEAVVTGNFAVLMLLGRFRYISDVFAGVDVPPTMWLQNAPGEHACSAIVGLEPDRLETIALQLQRASLGARVREQDELRTSITYARDLAATIRGTAAMTKRQDASKLAREALMLTGMKSVAQMRDLVHQALQICFPPTYEAKAAEDNDDKARNDDGPLLSGYNRIRTGQFQLDVAYMLVRRDESHRAPCVRWGWGDSSPQGGFDWLLWKYRAVLVANLLTVFRAMRTLTTCLVVHCLQMMRPAPPWMWTSCAQTQTKC